MPKIAFNHRKLLSLEPPEKKWVAYFEDSGNAVPGLALRITTGGAKSWVLWYRKDGRQYLKTLGSFPTMGIADAKRQAGEDYKALRAGANPAKEKQDARKAPAVCELTARYLIDYAEVHKRPHSVTDDRIMIDKFILPRFGNEKVADIEQADIEGLHRSLKATPYRANRTLALLSKMFNLAESWKMRPQRTNPCRGIARYQEARRDRWLSGDELKALVTALDAYEDQSAASAIRLLILTGSRRGEVLNATWDQFDLERAVWTKPSHHTKQKRTEHVPLAAPTMALLAALKENAAGSRHLFPGKDANEPRADLKRPWATVSKAAGLSGVRLHDLRHSFASHLVSSGYGLHLVGKLLGHTQAATTLRYAHLADDPQREAVERFGAMFEALKGIGATVEPLTKGSRK